MVAIKSELGILADENYNILPCVIEIENDELYISNANGELFDYIRKDPNSLRIQKSIFHEKETLIENCLFGVDINSNSVNICRLRLWIELLKMPIILRMANYRPCLILILISNAETH